MTMTLAICGASTGDLAPPELLASFAITEPAASEAIAWSQDASRHVSVSVHKAGRTATSYSAVVFNEDTGQIYASGGGASPSDIVSFIPTDAGNYRADVSVQFDTAPFLESLSVGFSIAAAVERTAEIRDRGRPGQVIPSGGTYHVEIGANYLDLEIWTNGGGETVTMQVDGVPLVSPDFFRTPSQNKWSGRLWGFFAVAKDWTATTTWPDGQSISHALTIEEVPPKAEGIHASVSEGQQLPYRGDVEFSLGDEDTARTLLSYSYDLSGPHGVLRSASFSGPSVITTQTYRQEALEAGSYTITSTYIYTDGTEVFTTNFEVLSLPATPPKPLGLGIYPADGRVGQQFLLSWSDSEPTRTQVSFDASVDGQEEDVELGSLTHSKNVVRRVEGPFEIVGHIEYSDGFEASETHSIIVQPPIVPVGLAFNSISVTHERFSWTEEGNATLADAYVIDGVTYQASQVTAWGHGQRFIDVPYPAVAVSWTVQAVWGATTTAESNVVAYTPPTAAEQPERYTPLELSASGAPAEYVTLGDAIQREHNLLDENQAAIAGLSGQAEFDVLEPRLRASGEFWEGVMNAMPVGSKLYTIAREIEQWRFIAWESYVAGPPLVDRIGGGKVDLAVYFDEATSLYSAAVRALPLYQIPTPESFAKANNWPHTIG